MSHLARSVSDDDVATNGVVDVDRLSPSRLPRPGHEGVGLGGQCAHGAKVNNVSRKFSHQHLIYICSNLKESKLGQG